MLSAWRYIRLECVSSIHSIHLVKVVHGRATKFTKASAREANLSESNARSPSILQTSMALI